MSEYNFLSNSFIKELDQENDLFNISKKLKFIKLFLEKETNHLQKNNMVVL